MSLISQNETCFTPKDYILGVDIYLVNILPNPLKPQ
jgi:hypothetical protein